VSLDIVVVVEGHFALDVGHIVGQLNYSRSRCDTKHRLPCIYDSFVEQGVCYITKQCYDLLGDGLTTDQPYFDFVSLDIVVVVEGQGGILP